MGKKMKAVQPVTRITTNKVGGSKYVFYGYSGAWSFDIDKQDLINYLKDMQTKEDLL